MKEVTDHFHKEGILFSIRASNSETLLTMAADTENWNPCTINFQDMETNDFNWDSMPHSFLKENTVYLIIMAVAHIMYKWLLNVYS